MQRSIVLYSKIAVLRLAWTVALVLPFAVLHRLFSSVLVRFTLEPVCVFFDIQRNT